MMGWSACLHGRAASTLSEPGFREVAVSRGHSERRSPIQAWGVQGGPREASC